MYSNIIQHFIYCIIPPYNNKLLDLLCTCILRSIIIISIKRRYVYYQIMIIVLLSLIDDLSFFVELSNVGIDLQYHLEFSLQTLTTKTCHHLVQVVLLIPPFSSYHHFELHSSEQNSFLGKNWFSNKNKQISKILL